jgi:glutaminyl-tRNA synthetase
LEFESHRPLYNWFVENVGGFDPVPRQIEFAKLAITYVVLSKRRLKILVEQGHVEGWDDPRMPTLAGMRRRGYLPESLRAFCARVGVSKRDSLVDLALFEHRVREDLNVVANRTMAVLNPLKVVITNMAEGKEEQFEVPVHPEFPDRGVRTVTLTRTVFVEQDDYMEDAPNKWFRLAPGKEVRLRGACLVTVEQAIKDAQGDLVELHVRWDPESRGGAAPDGRKVKGTIHWISDKDAVNAEVRLYDRLFTDENPTGYEDKDFLEFLNPNSVTTLKDALVHRQLVNVGTSERYQFERLGYFCLDTTSTVDKPVVNRVIGLRDSWTKQSTK